MQNQKTNTSKNESSVILNIQTKCSQSNNALHIALLRTSQQQKAEETVSIIMLNEFMNLSKEFEWKINFLLIK